MEENIIVAKTAKEIHKEYLDSQKEMNDYHFQKKVEAWKERYPEEHTQWYYNN